MSDNFVVGVITSVEDVDYQGKAFKKVTLGTGQVLNVKYGREGVLKAKWGLLVVGTAVKFTMMDFTTGAGIKIPFVSDIETVESQLPPHIEPTAFAETAPIPATREPAPQELGMWYKEIGENYRAGKLEGTTGKALMTAYWARMFTVVGIGKEKPKEVDPDNIPF